MVGWEKREDIGLEIFYYNMKEAKILLKVIMRDRWPFIDGHAQRQDETTQPSGTDRKTTHESI